MRSLSHLFENNRAWSERIRRTDPDFFIRLSEQQRPRYLWIGCADSRVPANEIVGLRPGELFVHRNVANVVVHSDLNCLSVMQFAVDVLQIEHVIVCGHYGCSGVSAALQNKRVGLADNWLRHVQDVRSKHDNKMTGISDLSQCIDLLCGLNVIEQVANVCQSPRCAPVGSTMMENEPISGTGVTSFITVAPNARAFFVAAATSSTSTYAIQNEGAPGIICFIIPPPVPSPTSTIV